MNLPDKPQPRIDLREGTSVLEEYKTIAEESRFVMSRYMQALVIHIALMGFAAKEIAGSPSPSFAIALAIAVFILNFGAY